MLSIQRMKQQAGEEIFQAGERLFSQGGVHENRLDQRSLRYNVHDDAIYRVTIEGRSNPHCTCHEFEEKGICRHIVAAAHMAQYTGALSELAHRNAMEVGPELFSVLRAQLPDNGTVHMELEIHLEQEPNQLFPQKRLSMRVGEERLYVVRSIPQFIEAIDRGESVDFGKGFLFEPSWMHFDRTGEAILRILRIANQSQRLAGISLKGIEARSQMLPEPLWGELFSALSSMPFVLDDHGEKTAYKRVVKAHMPIVIRCSGSIRGLSLQIVYPKDFLPLTEDCAYAMVGGSIVEVDPAQRELMDRLYRYGEFGRASFEYPLAETPRVIDELLPFLKQLGTVEISEELDRMLVREPFLAKIYLDRVGRDVEADVIFTYGSREIHPFAGKQDTEFVYERGKKMLLRDSDQERRIMDLLGNGGFCLNRGKVILSGQEAIYRLMTDIVPRLQALAEVYMSRDFLKMSPRTPKLRGNLGFSDNGTLRFILEGIKLEQGEVLGLMEALARQRKYFRLRDGSFLDLQGLDAWQEPAEAILDTASQERSSAGGDGLVIQSYRAAYLSKLLDIAGVEAEQDDRVRSLVKELTVPTEETPEARLTVELRPYQKRGYAWLRTLDRLGMGGILADDMGLGKTIQMIALLRQYAGSGELSLVVAPTSLTYNWLNEMYRFAPELRAVVVSGAGNVRSQFYQRLREGTDLDVVITSYPLIRRDVKEMKDLHFHFVVLDEAQQIKNALSSGASAVKQIQAKARFALTGTPMENHVGELWSVFDFCLPGYLGPQSSFLHRYQYGNRDEELHRRIAPFLLRRMKKDVLSELPDKIEVEIMAQMTQEQNLVYQASLMRVREKVDEAIREGHKIRGRMDILSQITELREICCHPALALESYTGSSGKLELLMDILPQAISEGRRVLVFSQFTSMLDIIVKQLQVSGISYMYLSGSTPAEERLDMCDRFNRGEGEVFLISLRAGGTGLNLTGADMVIHYDPWWNPAVEDQATDRAYRIGQKHKVEVIRLITRESIEERVVHMSKAKRVLFDQLITPGEHSVAGLTEEDIRELFH